MFYVLIENSLAKSVTTDYPQVDGRFDSRYQNRNDWKTLERAEAVAEQLNEAADDMLYIAIDNGPSVSPRFDVIKAPKVGEQVSRYFNGDSYPEGEIVKISATLKRVETSTGAVFFRRKQSGVWSDGTFGMIAGHHNERNPSF
jgi:hypothetical protein